MIINLLLWILFGAVIGWVAGLIMKTKKGLVARIVVGILGALLGGFIASVLPIDALGGLGGTFQLSIGNILVCIGGAVLVIIIARALKILK